MDPKIDSSAASSEETNQEPPVSSGVSSPWHRPLVADCVVALFALFVAALYVFGVAGDPLVQQPILDLRQYAELAASMASGDMPVGAFFVDPLYLMIRASLIEAFGDGVWPPLILNFMALAVSAIFFRRLVALMADDRVALVAALLLPLCAPLLFFQAFPMKETLALALMLAAILSLFQWRGGAGAGNIIRAGSLMGLAVLCRGNLLIILPVFVLSPVLFAPTRAKGVQAAALFLTFFVLPILPVTAWNYHASGAVIPITYNMGNNFYQGNNPDHQSTDFYNPAFIRDNPAFEELDWRREMAARLAARCPGCSPVEPTEILPSELSRFWRGEALEHVVDAPVAFIQRSFAKLARLLSDSEITNNVPMDYMAPRSWILRYGTYGFGVLVFLGIPAWILAFRRLRYGLELSAMGLLYAAGVSAFYVLSRLKLPLIPVLLVPISLLGCQLWDRYSKSARGQAKPPADIRLRGAAGLALVLCGVMAFWPHADREGLGEYNLGVLMIDRGDWSAAESALTEAVEKNPEFAPAHVNLGRVLVNQGKHEAALKVLGAVTRMRPAYARGWAMLGEVLIRLGRFPEAEGALTRSVELVPDNPTSLVNLGMVFARTHREAKAIPFFEGAWRLAPDPDSGVALVTALLNVGESRRAKGVAAEAVQRFPDSAQLQNLYRIAQERVP